MTSPSFPDRAWAHRMVQFAGDVHRLLFIAQSACEQNVRIKTESNLALAELLDAAQETLRPKPTKEGA